MQNAAAKTEGQAWLANASKRLSDENISLRIRLLWLHTQIQDGLQVNMDGVDELKKFIRHVLQSGPTSDELHTALDANQIVPKSMEYIKTEKDRVDTMIQTIQRKFKRPRTESDVDHDADT